MTTSSTDNDPVDVYLRVHQLLAKHRCIATIWYIDDVKGVRPDLTDDQAWEVLQEVERHHDAEYGINWTTLEITAEMLFPEPSTTGRQP